MMKKAPSAHFDAHGFQLDPSCYLVRGAVRGAIYNLKTGSVFSIDAKALGILDACERGLSLAEVLAKNREVEESEMVAYLEQVAAGEMGAFCEHPVPYIEKWQPAMTRDQRVRQRQPMTLAYAFLELTPECDLNCTFCTPGDQVVRRRTGCSRWATNGDGELRLSDGEWTTVIDDLAWLRCPALHFIGGEPFMAADLLMRLIAQARDQGIRGIYVSTNTMLLDDERIAFMARHGVHAVVQVFSHRPEAHDRLTGRPGSHQALVQNLKKLQEAGVPYLFNLVIDEETAVDSEETRKYLTSFGPQQIAIDVVRRNSPAATVATKSAPYAFRSAPQFGTTSVADFFRRREYHGCWVGKLAVTAEGEVLPCIVARTEQIGNVRHKSLKEMYRDQDFHSHWTFTIDQVPECTICEYRYACPDCRPIARTMCGRLTAKDPFCRYDPATGRWQGPEVPLQHGLSTAAEQSAPAARR